MTDRLTIALAQLNPTVGDIDGNLKRARDARAEAAAGGADLIVLSELFVVGYPPEDLVLRPSVQRKIEGAVGEFAAETGDGGPAVLLPTPWVQDGLLYNAVALLDGGEIAAIRCKRDLPNYGVFDEKRVFEPGALPGPVNIRGVRVGVPICEDIWTPEVTECLAETGAEILIVPNGSPFEEGKFDVRINHSVARIVETGLPLVYVNQVGGQDELIFDGASFVLNADRSLALQLPAYEERVVLTRWRRNEDETWVCDTGERTAVAMGAESVYMAMVLGLRDYVNKNRFPGVVLGLSGGVDSALSAAVAVDALGTERVHCVMMPSRFTSQQSLDDASEAARLLGARLDTIAIGPAVDALEAMMKPIFDNRPADTTEENIQSRVRGIILMAISNKLGSMVLTTGNKSEMSVGYATLYGDMCGGYSVLKDIYKTDVYELCNWRNQHAPAGALGPAGRVVPEAILHRAPSAELRPDQTDQDSLPPYAALDDILEGLVEAEAPVEQIAKRGHEVDLVRRVENMLYIAEYKRRQAPPGVKVTRRNFGRDRRYPITNRFRDRP